MNDTATEIERSENSGPITQDGISIHVEIYRLGRNKGWTLEVMDHEGGSTLWETTFETDGQAHRVFKLALELEGIRSFADAPLANKLNLRLRSLTVS